MSIEQIIGGSTADGQRYLELFLKDYTKLFSTKVNPSCKNCLKNYLQNYKSKLLNMENNCKYRLKKKYNGIQTKFGSGIFVTNDNITDELGKELFKNHKNPEQLFERYPKEQIEVKAEEVKPPKKKRRTTTKK